MRRIGMAVCVLLVITLAGLPAGVQAEGDDDCWLHQIYGGKEYEKN